MTNTKKPTQFFVVFKRSDRLGSEEYDGGTTIEDARQEARFFCDHLPEHVSVRICTVDVHGRLSTQEVVR